MESLNTIHGINTPFKLYGAEVQWCTSVITVPGRLGQDWKLKDSLDPERGLGGRPGGSHL